MEDSVTYAIGYLLPKPAAIYHLDLWARIENTFRLTGNNRPKAPAHITLKYPFPAENIEEVENILQAFATTAKSSPWTVRGFDRFVDGDSYVIFLDVLPTDGVRQAHADLLDRLRAVPSMQWDRFDNADLHYHVTVAAKGLTATNFAAVWSFVNAEQPPNFDLLFDNLALVKINGDVHTLYKTFRLTGGANS